MSTVRVPAAVFLADGAVDRSYDREILAPRITIDPGARVAVETAIKGHDVILLGEISRGARPDDLETIVRGVLSDIGHGDGRWGLDLETLRITDLLGEQAQEIADSVVGDGSGDLGAGDQGMMFGYACDDTPELMPLPIALAHRLMQRQREIRATTEGAILGPDAKAQVTGTCRDGRPVGLETVVISTQHTADVTGGT